VWKLLGDACSMLYRLPSKMIKFVFKSPVWTHCFYLLILFSVQVPNTLLTTGSEGFTTLTLPDLLSLAVRYDCIWRAWK
jgi:hypothetical protein